MFKINVHGDTVIAKVTPDGVFYVEGRPENSKTLKGLQTKLNELKTPLGQKVRIPVEHIHSFKQGFVTGVTKKNAYRKTYRVHWNDGKHSAVTEWILRKPMTTEQRAHLQALEQAAKNAEDAYTAAQDTLDNYSSEFEVGSELRTTFNA